MKKVRIFTVLFVLSLAACAPSANVISTAIAQTQAALPTVVLPTPTMPFAAAGLDLQPYLIQENDLPSGYSKAPGTTGLPPNYEDFQLPVADYTINQDLERDNYSADFVRVLIYESQDNLEDAYQKFISERHQLKSLADVGGKGQMSSVSIPVPPINFKDVELIFVKCHAVVHISISGTDNEQDVIFSAKRLAERLKTLVCQ